jgi:cellulose synthase operon protein C
MLRLAHALHRAGDPAGAAATIRSLQRAQGGGAVADRLSGHLAADLGQWRDAIVHFQRVRRRIGNRDVVVLRELARAHLALGEVAEADRYATLAGQLQPLNGELLALWADVRARKGDAKAAADLRARVAQLR